LGAVVDRSRAATAAQRLYEERTAATPDFQQDVVRPGLQLGQHGAERRTVVSRVAIARARVTAGRPAGGAIGEPVAVHPRRRARPRARRTPPPGRTRLRAPG